MSGSFKDVFGSYKLSSFAFCFAISRVTTCLENLEMSGNLKHVREMSGIMLTVREMSGKKSKCPKTVH